MIATKRFLGLLTLVTLLGACGWIKSEESHFFDSTGKPLPALSAVLDATGIHHDGTRGDVIAKTQQAWLRPAGVERFNMTDPWAEKHDQIKPLCKQLGLIDPVMPAAKIYDYALVHGALVLAMRARIAFLVKLWQAGIRFKRVVILTGKRDLDPRAEPAAAFEDRKQQILPIRSDWQRGEKPLPQFESDAAAMIYDQAALPADMRALPVDIIDAPKITTASGDLARPNTQSTVATWLATNPSPGLCLAITNQPFVGYQDAILKTVLPKGFTVETVGFGVPTREELAAVGGGPAAATLDAASAWLDSLARWMYQENLRQAQK